MKNLLGTLASATLFATMFHAPYATILTILALVVLSDLWSAIAPTTPITRADDKAAWDVIFEEPDPIEQPTEDEYNAMFADEEEPIILSYKEVQATLKSKYTASQRKKLGIKLNASREVLESWL